MKAPVQEACMKLSTKILTLLALCAVCAMPLAIASAATAHPGKAHSHSSSASANGKAYGKVCLAKGLSKSHVKGEKGTLFSQCVTAMAHAAKTASTTTTSTDKNAAKSCSAMTKKHVAGVKGTPFSDCVAAAKVVIATKS
jgi:putative hemolysin